MDVKVYPGVAEGTVKIPPSKSMAHRAIIAASLAEGQSMITNIAFSDDIRATIGCMQKMGAIIEMQDARLLVTGIGGLKGLQELPEDLELDCNESGSTLRFLLPIFAMTGKDCSFVGRGRLLARPQSVYEEIFANQGLKFEHTEDVIKICGPLSAGTYQVAGNVSSQFISGLLFTLPLLAGDSLIEIKKPVESRSYIELTLDVLRSFGIKAEWKDDNTLFVPGNQQYSAAPYEVEGDFSQFAFWAVLAACNKENFLGLSGVNPDSKQGDKVILDILEGCGTIIDETCAGYTVQPYKYRPYQADLADCPDLGPILMVLASRCHGQSLIKNAGRLRLKESDRLAAMEEEFEKLNIEVQPVGDMVFVEGGGLAHGGEVDGHNDHRVVMSLAILGALSTEPITIHGAEAINKSYPNFFEDLQSVGIKVEFLD